MMFDFKSIHKIILKFAVSLLALAFFALPASAQQTAVVPDSIIYPGQTISRDMVRQVRVINPNLRPGYAKVIAEVDGFVTKKTLLPGRVIPVSVLREAYLVERGKNIPLVFVTKTMVISAQGVALQNGGLGDVIKARNLDSGVIISGTIMNDGTLRAMPK